MSGETSLIKIAEQSMRLMIEASGELSSHTPLQHRSAIEHKADGYAKAFRLKAEELRLALFDATFIPMAEEVLIPIKVKKNQRAKP